LATVKLTEVPEPVLPSDEWVKIKTWMCGFCGSDLNLILLRESPTGSPFTSFPCVIGHEICGEIIEVGRSVAGFEVGDGVTVAPYLSCAVRGISPECPACRSGKVAACENFARGSLAPGMFTGICKEINGGFAPFVVAHQSQLFKLPPGISPEAGVLTEPFSVAIQAVWDNRPQDGEAVLVIGGGVIGSLIVRAIRGLEIDCRITVAEKSDFAAKWCRKAGADRLITDGDLFDGTVQTTNAARYKPMMGPDILMGGFSRIFDTVGNSGTVNIGLRCLAAQGTYSLVGIEHRLRFDPSPLFFKLQTIKGAFSAGYVTENGQRRHVFELALKMAHEQKVDLEDMVTHKFALDDFDKILEINLAKGRHRAMKTVVSFM
jgi:threonine dehydrogenase-like Zn-dependent dehydrogenase